MSTETATIERIFYDGDCGFCHWSVSLVARLDPKGRTFRFAPLGGPTFDEVIPPERRGSLPDSLIVQARDGRLLTRSAGAIYIFRRLGFVWRLAGSLLWLIPKPLRDWGYDVIARIRLKLASQPEGTCPILPPELRARFDP